MENSKRDAMLHEDIAHLINRLAIPTIISQLITSLYNMADTYWVAQLNNDSATAAVGIVFAIMALIQALGFFCGHGSGNFISRMLGANKVKEARLMAMTGFTLAFILGIVLMAFGLIFLEPLAYALGSTSTMLPYAKEYMSWILIGAPIMMAALVLTAGTLSRNGKGKEPVDYVDPYIGSPLSVSPCSTCPSSGSSTKASPFPRAPKLLYL